MGRLGGWLLVVLVSFPLASQEYAWPTDASQYLTSSFCEFRPRHYHAAFDIKTWNQSGYKIFAIDDGYIYRVRVSATGYGKAIYLKLNDGNHVVYGHLQGFTPELQEWADRRRLETRQNILNAYPGPEQFPVTKGQHIGYTGETGIGVPHLHFELRNRHHQPINPMPFYRDRITDTVAPRFHTLAVIPHSPGAFIDFRPDTLFAPLDAGTRQSFPRSIYLTGEAYLAIRTWDMADGVTNRYDFYQAEMFINDSLVYRIGYDRFSYDETRLIELDKNFSLMRKGKRIFHNFYRHPANSLPFYDITRKGAGLLSGESLREGANTVRIVVRDYHGNASELRIPVVYHRALNLVTETVRRTEGRWEWRLASPLPLADVRLSVGGRPVANRQLVPLDSLSGSTFRYRVELADGAVPADAMVEARFRYGDGIPALPVWQAADPDSVPAALPVSASTLHFFRDHLALDVPGRWRPADAVVWPGVPVHQYAPDRYRMAFTADVLDALVRQPIGSRAELLDTLSRWIAVRPGREKTVFSRDGVVEVYFPTNAAYDPMRVSILHTTHDTPVPAPYRVLSDVYQVEPFDAPFNFGASIRFHLPDSLMTMAGVGIYYKTAGRNHDWKFLPTELDAAGEAFATRITSLEKFTVIQDTVPPSILPLNLQQFRAGSRATPDLLFLVRDDFSGIYGERQIAVEVNGEWSIFEYDPEEKRVMVPGRMLPPGDTVVQLMVSDNAGNTRLESVTLRIAE